MAEPGMIEREPIDMGLWRAGCSVTGKSGCMSRERLC
jgi:hypothetical protein